MHKNKSLQVVVIYRPPNTSKRLFLDEFSGFLDSLNDLKNIILCGDFNLHFENSNDRYVCEFAEMLESHNLENCVNDPTSQSNHIIDLIIQNKDAKIIKQLDVEPDCSISPVHKMVNFNINIWNSTKKTKTITYRNKTNFEAERFIVKCSTEIRAADLKCDCYFSGRSATDQVCVNCFTRSNKTILTDNYNDNCPKATKQIIEKENSKWYNGELCVAKKKKRKMEDKWRRSKNLKRNENWELYKKARNEYNTLIEKTKKEYYSDVFSNTNNSKNIHKNLDELLGLKREKILPTVTSNYEDMTNDFVNYFEDKIEKICYSFYDQAEIEVPRLNNPRQIDKLSHFNTLSFNEFKKITTKIKNTYCENDPFPISDITNAKNFDQLQGIYLDTVNMSLTQAIFPESEKLASIKPIYKGKGDIECLNSYRPISNLSYLSKIIERTVYEQTWAFLRSQKIIPNEQSAYRENHSTETTVCAITSDMTEIVANGKCGILIMLDLSAAFDTVDHKLLLDDLRHVGIDNAVYNWYDSYLKNREVQVVISGEKSEIKKLARGVPQGSVLGSLLFCIYTIELSNILNKHNVKFKLYADDTQFYFPIDNVDDAKKKIDEIMKDIKEWMMVKKLKLNEDKTECMLFGSTRTLKKFEQLKNITIGSSTINITTVVKNLGVLINNNLSMKNQILQTVKTCNYHIRNIAFIKKYLSENALETAICNHVLSRLDYCNSVYYGLPKYLLKKLQNIQNRAARLIKGASPRDRITPSLIELHWLPVKARIEYKILLLTFKILKYNEPLYLRISLTSFGLETNVTVRHASDTNRLFEPRTENCFGERAFKYFAPRLYNRLPREMKNIQEEQSFKKSLKTLLFKRSYDLETKALQDEYKV